MHEFTKKTQRTKTQLSTDFAKYFTLLYCYIARFSSTFAILNLLLMSPCTCHTQLCRNLFIKLEHRLLVISESLSVVKDLQFLGYVVALVEVSWFVVWEGSILCYMAKFPTSEEQVYKLLVN